MELGQLQQYYERFRDAGVQLVAVSVDSVRRNKILKARLGADYEFLSDPAGDLLSALDIVHFNQSRPDKILALASQFLVDKSGIIRWEYLPETWRNRMPAKSLLNEIQQIDSQ